MSDHTALYTSFISLGNENAKAVRTAAGAVVAAIMAANDPIVEMTALFSAARKPYLAAKADKAEAEMKVCSSAWHGLTAGLGYHFEKADKVAKFPNFRSGDGEYSLSDVAVVREKAKAEREQKAEREAAELAEYKADQKRAQIDAWARLDVTAQAAQLANMIQASGRAVALIDTLSPMLAKLADELRTKEAAENEKAAKAAAAKAAKAAKAAAAKAAKAAAKAEKFGLVRREPMTEKKAA